MECALFHALAATSAWKRNAKKMKAKRLVGALGVALAAMAVCTVSILRSQRSGVEIAEAKEEKPLVSGAKIADVYHEGRAVATTAGGGQKENEGIVWQEAGEAQDAVCEAVEATGDGDMPFSAAYPGVEPMDFRESVLPPKTKNGRERVLREWLIKPGKNTYVHHLEEEYESDDNGELKLAATKEYVANQVIMELDGEADFEEFKDEMQAAGVEVRRVLMTLDKGRRLVAVAVPDETFEAVDRLIEAARGTKARPEVSLDYVKHKASTIPNDEFFGD